MSLWWRLTKTWHGIQLIFNGRNITDMIYFSFRKTTCIPWERENLIRKEMRSDSIPGFKQYQSQPLWISERGLCKPNRDFIFLLNSIWVEKGMFSLHLPSSWVFLSSVKEMMYFEIQLVQRSPKRSWGLETTLGRDPAEDCQVQHHPMKQHCQVPRNMIGNKEPGEGGKGGK